MSGEFPYLSEYDRFDFPSVERSTEEGIVGVGGNLSPGMLLSAYRQGIFPWFSEREPILWWSPDPRFVLFPEELHVSKTLKKALSKSRLRVSCDRNFSSVIDECARIPRRGQSGTWITGEMRDAYLSLHELGYAHSVEAYDGHELVGGLYGVSLGRCFFGESMFSLVDNASKIAFVRFVRAAMEAGMELIDCQVYTNHLERFGARDIPRSEFLALLRDSLKYPTMRGSWTGLILESASSDELPKD